VELLRQAVDAVSRDGRTCRIEWFFDHAEALKAVGITE
jgi:hypothetical protein